MNPKVVNFIEKQREAESFKKPLKQFIDKSLALQREMEPEYDYCDTVYQVINRKGRDRFNAMDTNQAIQSLLQLEDLGTVAGQNELTPVTLKACQATLFLQGKLTVSDPTVTISPMTTSQSDIRAAEFAKQFVKYFRKITELDEVLESGVYLNCACKGTGIAYIGWNPYAGLPSPEQLSNPNEALGDFEVTDVSPRDFFVDPAAKTFREATKCIRRIYMPVEQVKYAFPERRGVIDKYLKKREEQNYGPYGDRMSGGDDTPDTIPVFEYWEKKLPWNNWQGKFFYFVDLENPEYLTDIKPHPYEHGLLPFIMLTDVDIADSPYGMSRLVLASTTFDTLSTVYSVVLNNAMLHGQIHLMYPSGEIPEEVLSDATYKAIPYSPHSGNRPEHLRPTAVSGDFWKIEESILREIHELWGMGEFSQGQINRELSSYSIQMAIEQDDKFRIRLFNKKKRFIQKIYEQGIALAKQFVGDSRWLSIAGGELSDELAFFKGSDLEGGYVLQVDFGMMIPADPAARKNQILEIIKMGIAQEAGIDMKKLLGLLVDGDVLSLKTFAEGAREVQNAENLKLSLGVNVPVEKYQEHKEHLFSLTTYMNSQEFEVMDSVIKENFVKHREKHMDALAELTAGAAEGGGAPGGEKPPPAGGELPPV